MRSNVGKEMGAPETGKLTIGAFFAAIAGRDGRYELVDGVAYAMTGAKEGHNVICSNVQTALVPAGKARGCRTTSSDTAIQTGPDTVRYPDVVVDCSPPNPETLTASKPTIVVEVSSPGTAVFDYGAKLREYQDLASVEMVLQIESEFALAKIHRRAADGTWIKETAESFDVPISFASLGTSLTLGEIYDTLDVRPRPRLEVVNTDRSA